MTVQTSLLERFRCEFDVLGIPASKGSWRSIMIGGRPRLVPMDQKYKPWVKAVRLAADRHKPKEPIDRPVLVDMVFRLPEPKKPRWSVPAVKPDIDKLTRAVLDALTGVIFKDDSRVIGMVIRKEYGQPHGATITVIEQ